MRKPFVVRLTAAAMALAVLYVSVGPVHGRVLALDAPAPGAPASTTECTAAEISELPLLSKGVVAQAGSKWGCAIAIANAIAACGIAAWDWATPDPIPLADEWMLTVSCMRRIGKAFAKCGRAIPGFIEEFM